MRFKQRTHRDKEGVFVVEGNLLFDRARSSGLTPLEVFVTSGNPVQSELKTTIVDPLALDKASYRNRSQGLIAVFEQFPRPIEAFPIGPSPLILVAESVEKPGNLGAMLRTVDAVGATGLITTGSPVDLFNPNLIRSSTGAVFTVPYAHAGLSELVVWLTERDVELVATVPGATDTYWAADLAGSVAIMVGAEDTGLSREAREAADLTVSIPMSGASDSLNVSVAAALLAFEARRQRSSLGD